MIRLVFNENAYGLREDLIPLMDLANFACFFLDTADFMNMQVGDDNRLFGALLLELDIVAEHHELLHTPFGVHLPTFISFLEQFDEDLTISFLIEGRRIRFEDERGRLFTMLMVDNPIPLTRIDYMNSYHQEYNRGIVLDTWDFIDPLTDVNNLEGGMTTLSITDNEVTLTSENNMRIVDSQMWSSAAKPWLLIRFQIEKANMDVYTHASNISDNVMIQVRAPGEQLNIDAQIGFRCTWPDGFLFLYCPLIAEPQSGNPSKRPFISSGTVASSSATSSFAAGSEIFGPDQQKNESAQAIASKSSFKSPPAHTTSHLCQQLYAAEYTRTLSDVEPGDMTPAVRDQIYDEVRVPDSQGYLRTFGSGVHVNEVYKNSDASSMSHQDEIVKLKATQDKMMEDINFLLNRVVALESVNGRSSAGANKDTQGTFEELICYYVRELVMNPKAEHTWHYLRVSLSCASRNDMIEACDSKNLDALQKEFPL